MIRCLSYLGDTFGFLSKLNILDIVVSESKVLFEIKNLVDIRTIVTQFGLDISVFVYD